MHAINITTPTSSIPLPSFPWRGLPDYLAALLGCPTSARNSICDDSLARRTDRLVGSHPSHVFRGDAGLSADRQIFGCSTGSSALRFKLLRRAWTCWRLRQYARPHAAGRMCNAGVTIRSAFSSLSMTLMRCYLAFCFAGFFAGIAGALAASFRDRQLGLRGAVRPDCFFRLIAASAISLTIIGAIFVPCGL